MQVEWMLALTELPAYLALPVSWLGRFALFLAWVLSALLVGWIVYAWRRYPSRWHGEALGMILLASAASALTTFFVGVRLTATEALPPPGLPIQASSAALMVFSALPWMVVAGFYGLFPALIVAGISGLLLMIWSTHSLFTILEYLFYAAFFSAMIHQRYRTLFYRWLRHPLIASVMVSAVTPLIFLLTRIWLVDGSLAVRLDYTLTNLYHTTLASAGMLWIGGAVAEVAFLLTPKRWGNPAPLVPSPSERSLSARFIYLFMPLILLLTVFLMGIVWRVAESAARRMLTDRLQGIAQLTTDSIPYFLESGQNMIQRVAQDQRLISGSPTEIDGYLQEHLRIVPFFTQFYVLNQQGESIAGYPQGDYNRAGALVAEQMGIRLALGGVPFQSYSAPPQGGEDAAQISFIAALRDGQGITQRVLVGRTSLRDNPMTQSLLSILREMARYEGEGILLDENGLILYHPQATRLLEPYSGRTDLRETLFDETAADGTRRLVYVKSARGRPWTVILSLPARQAQQLAINIAAPILIAMFLLGGGAILYFNYNLSKITSSLRVLAEQATSISQGRLDKPIEAKGEDEEGRLRAAFETMRLSLKARLDELNRLLWVSQGVASSLELSQAIRPVLEAALSLGAASVRVVLSPGALPGLDVEENRPTVFADGHAAQLYADLDEQVLSVCRQQERLLLSHPFRPRLLTYPPNVPVPESLCAIALKLENEIVGALWLAFDLPHTFSEEELRFMTTLAGQAALAVANARHFLTAEIGRKRLEAILTSTPDPILVTDPKGRVSLANPAALRAFSSPKELMLSPEQIRLPQELSDLMHAVAESPRAIEVTLPDGKIYSATASTVFAEGRPVNRVCLLRDITHFKELDALKSEFVANVSHDLRSPLTLMRGYATMLEMAGSLNEHQLGYVQKIILSVENMTRLVNNLLDLGRIEAGVALQLELVAPKELVEKAVNDVQLQATQKRIQLSTDLPVEGLPLIEVDAALLNQALHNLLDNAIKFTEAGGKVQVSARLKENQIVFAVRDTGIGIAPLDQPRLFDKFFRVKRPGTKSSGSGLGLAIVKSVAERHHGRAWVESQLGRGSTFYISLPIRQPRETQPPMGDSGRVEVVASG
ncbi:MAG: ATP-binding protein [Anaerolineales bacterium]|nr:ATP-binding protein [Anaerolineales bacterium]